MDGDVLGFSAMDVAFGELTISQTGCNPLLAVDDLTFTPNNVAATDLANNDFMF